MAKITRPNLNVLAFGSQTSGTGRTVFGSSTQSDDLTDNLNTAFFEGWNTIGQKPPRQWENGAMFAISQLVSYLFQTGIAEWNVNQEYHLNSIVIGSNGNIYQSLSNNNQGNDPTVDAVNWISFASKYTLDINGLTEKVKPVDNDILVIEDSADSFNKKKVKFSTLGEGYKEFGIGTNSVQLSTPTNLDNAINKNGLYYSSSISSFPGSASAGYVFHQQASDSFVNQILIDSTGVGAGEVWSRTKVDGVWNIWKKLVTEDEIIGIGQTWQDVTASRSAGVTYTNSTGKPIVVNVSTTLSAVNSVTIIVDGNNLGYNSFTASNGNSSNRNIVPNGSTYSVIISGSSVNRWFELR